MSTNSVTRSTSLLLATLALGTAAARADIKLNDNFSVAGYAAGSYQYNKPSGGTSSDSFDVNAAKLSFLTDFKPVTGNFGFYYTPTSTGTSDITLIDANVSYDAGNGVTVTGGKFLSWMGYEAFDAVNKFQVSSAYINNTATIMFYPAYHEGVKIKYSDAEWTTGVALLDSVNGPTIFRGDGELKHNAGFEGFVKYTGIKDLAIFGGVAYDTKGNKSYQKEAFKFYNLWVEYTMGDALIAGEYIYTDNGPSNTGSTGLILLNYKFSKELSSAFRISAGKLDDNGAIKGAKFTKFTVSPAYAVSPNLIVRPELSYIDYKNVGASNETYIALQAIFKF